MINHEILSKTNRLTNLMTNRPRIFKRTFGFLLVTFQLHLSSFFTQMECSAVVNFNLKTLRTKITWLCPFSHINTLSDKKIYVYVYIIHWSTMHNSNTFLIFSPNALIFSIQEIVYHKVFKLQHCNSVKINLGPKN